MTQALADEMWQASPERQGYLLLAQADRGETEALATVLAAARRGHKSLRLVAIGILDRYGNPSSSPTLPRGRRRRRCRNHRRRPGRPGENARQ